MFPSWLSARAFHQATRSRSILRKLLDRTAVRKNACSSLLDYRLAVNSQLRKREVSDER